MQEAYLNGLNEKQKEAVLHLKGPLMIIAGAGSGKGECQYIKSIYTTMH